jgi:hypothetical protein
MSASRAAGYLICLFQALAAHPQEVVIQREDHAVPGAQLLCRGDAALLAWMASEDPALDRTDVEAVIRLLRHLAGFRWFLPWRSAGRVRAVVLGEDGRPTKAAFLVRDRSADGGWGVRVSLAG